MSTVSESIFEAIDIIVKQRLDLSSFDKTVTCTIVSYEGDGKYKVQDEGGVIYDAYSKNFNYEPKEKVYVLIPLGQYSNTKIILNSHFTHF